MGSSKLAGEGAVTVVGRFKLFYNVNSMWNK